MNNYHLSLLRLRVTASERRSLFLSALLLVSEHLII